MAGRHELKFLIEMDRADRLFSSLKQHCVPDEHGDSEGRYEVASLYYDTPDRRFYWDRTESVGYRRKVRLRCYNNEQVDAPYFLEIKEKHKAKVVKKRASFAYSESSPFPDFAPVLSHLPDGEVARELKYLDGHFSLRPMVVVRYVRRSYAAVSQPRLRITLDDRLSAGRGSLKHYDRENEVLFLDPRLGVLEVKSDRAIPLWLQQELRRSGVDRVRYSKYCEALDALDAELRCFDRQLANS